MCACCRTGHLSSLTVGGDDNTAAAHSGEESEADSEEARDVDSSPTNGSRTIAAAATSMLGSATDSSSSSSRQHRGQHNKQKQLQAVQLSKLEAATMLKAKQQHKELIAQPKVGAVGGEHLSQRARIPQAVSGSTCTQNLRLIKPAPVATCVHVARGVVNRRLHLGVCLTALPSSPTRQPSTSRTLCRARHTEQACS